MKKVNLKYINNNETGFALIACLSILSLLVMLSLAMVSLASVSQRTAIGSEALEEAEANARLALSEAIANLQRKAGLDTRITASARSVSVNSQSSSFVTGVWRSWEGTNHSVEALPHMPGLESDTPGIGSVSLLGSGSLGSSNNSEIVRVDPTLVLDGNGNVTGGQAYWVQGLNSKALMKKPAAAPATGLERASNMSSNASPNVENFDIDPSEALENFVSLATLDFVKEDLRKNNFHDITHYSRGLLTNSATGGWRRDLSLLMEGWWDANASDRKFDETRNFFTLEPGVEFSYTASESVNTPYFIYPFSSKFDHVNEQNGSNIGSSSSSWNAVGDFMMQYKQVDSLSDDGYARFSPRSSELDRSGRGRNRDIRLRWRRDLNFRQPNLARFHYIYYLGAEKDESTDTYSAKVLIEPYITYWNPYNVEVDAVHSGTEVTLISALPFNIKLEVGSGAVIELDQLASNNDFTVDFNDATAGVMQPGETRIFSGSPNESLNNTLNMVNGVSTEEAQIVKDLGADFSNLDAEDIVTVELVPSTNADLRSIRFVQQTAGGTAPMNIL